MTASTPQRSTRDAERTAWAMRPDLAPACEVPLDQAQSHTRAMLEAAGVDVDDVIARVEAAGPVLGRGRPRLSANADTEVLTFRAPSDQVRNARELARREGRGFAALMRDALDQYLTAHAA